MTSTVNTQYRKPLAGTVLDYFDPIVRYQPIPREALA